MMDVKLMKVGLFGGWFVGTTRLKALIIGKATFVTWDSSSRVRFLSTSIPIKPLYLVCCSLYRKIKHHGQG